MTKAEAKKRLRAEISGAEQELPDTYQKSSNTAIASHLMALPEYRSADTVFCYVSVAREIDTRPVLEDALRHGKRLCVPLCVEKGRMELRQITSLEQLHPGAYGIPEPPGNYPCVEADSVDFAVVPCKSCDRTGHRLGRGGGYYDHFLASYRAAAVLVCRERLLRDPIPMEPHDSIVPWVVTEQGLYEDGVPARPE